MSPATQTTQTQGTVEYLNPEGLFRSPAFTQVVVARGPVKTVYIGGQDAVDAAGNIVGKGDLRTQTEQILKNIEVALSAAGARLEHVVKWNVYVVQGQSLRAGFEAFQSVWGRRPNPPAISGMFVAGLANPDFLAEIDAIAVVPEKSVE
jgi:enamine deaminase RidA (YjgF/YER057c/UK114 family)